MRNLRLVNVGGQHKNITCEQLYSIAYVRKMCYLSRWFNTVGCTWRSDEECMHSGRNLISNVQTCFRADTRVRNYSSYLLRFHYISLFIVSKIRIPNRCFTFQFTPHYVLYEISYHDKLIFRISIKNLFKFHAK